MSTTSLRPLLRGSVHSLSPCPRCHGSSFTISTTQRRTATMIRRPQRPQRFEQIVILSDGSSYKQLTTSPQGIFRSSKDVRNHVLWNPSSEKLANVEEDEAGRLKKFREKFGTGFDASRALAQEAGDTAAVKAMDTHWEDGGMLSESKVEKWKEAVASQPSDAPAAPPKAPADDNLFGLISGSYIAPDITDYGRRAKRAKRNAKNPPPGASSNGGGGDSKK